MKTKKVSLFVTIITIILVLMIAGCTNRVYKQGKPFKPDRRNQVTNCHTYYDARR